MSTTRNKAIIPPLVLVLASAFLLFTLVSLLFVSGQAEQNESVKGEQTSSEKVIETVFLVGIILSPISFVLSVVALWVALKNRRTVYEVK